MQCCESCHLSCCLHMSAMIFLFFFFCFVFVLLLLCFVFITFFKRKLFVLFCFCFHRGFETSLSLHLWFFKFLFFCCFFVVFYYFLTNSFVLFFVLFCCFCWWNKKLIQAFYLRPTVSHSHHFYVDRHFVRKCRYFELSFVQIVICPNCHCSNMVFSKWNFVFPNISLKSC